MTNSVVKRGGEVWQDFSGNRPISTSSSKEILPRERDYPNDLLSTRFTPAIEALSGRTGSDSSGVWRFLPGVLSGLREKDAEAPCSGKMAPGLSWGWLWAAGLADFKDEPIFLSELPEVVYGTKRDGTLQATPDSRS